MTRTRRSAPGFSLVEVALALGVAAFCLITVLGLMPAALRTQQTSTEQTTANAILSAQAADLRAAVRYPPGLQDKLNTQQKTINDHWQSRATPDKLYFTINGAQTGVVDASPIPSDAVFRLTLTYLFPPSETTSLAGLTVSWPAAVDPSDASTGTPAGMVQTFIAVNR
jgi:type II secretory pathway pseudopilin PulG